MSNQNELPEVTYQFKQDPEAIGRTPGDQVGKVLEQADFVEEAIEDETTDIHQINDVVIQLHHDIESFWRALARKYGQGYVDEVFQRHEERQEKVMQSDAV